MIKFAAILIAVILIGSFGFIMIPALSDAASGDPGITHPSGISSNITNTTEDIGAGTVSMIGVTIIIMIILAVLALFAGLVKL